MQARPFCDGTLPSSAASPLEGERFMSDDVLTALRAIDAAVTPAFAADLLTLAFGASAFLVTWGAMKAAAVNAGAAALGAAIAGEDFDGERINQQGVEVGVLRKKRRAVFDALGWVLRAAVAFVILLAHSVFLDSWLTGEDAVVGELSTFLPVGLDVLASSSALGCGLFFLWQATRDLRRAM
jgi:hypothetical protein